jgi:hypothetical protein
MDRQGKRRVQLACNKGYYFPELRQEIDLVHLMLISQNATFYFYEKRKRKTEYKIMLMLHFLFIVIHVPDPASHILQDT